MRRGIGGEQDHVVLSPEKMEWLEVQMQQLVVAGMVRRNRHATPHVPVWPWPCLKGVGTAWLRIPRAANAQAELFPWPMPDLEAMASRFGGVSAICSLDLLQGCWKMSLAEEAPNWFTIALTFGFYLHAYQSPTGSIECDFIFPVDYGRDVAGNVPEGMHGVG